MSLQLICINYGVFDDAVAVIKHCQRLMKFDHTEIVHPYPHTDSGIYTRKARSATQNECWIKELPNYVVCDHVLSVHWDGYIINSDKWTDEFLEYDWIGAPWRTENLKNKEWRVGSGGFCLFSRKISEIWRNIINEHEGFDWQIGVLYRDRLEALGIKFAPLELAARFSKEMNLDDIEIEEGSTFGFHGFQYNSEFRKKFKELVYQ